MGKHRSAFRPGDYCVYAGRGTTCEAIVIEADPRSSVALVENLDDQTRKRVLKRRLAWMPNPDQLAAAIAEIRAPWSPREDAARQVGVNCLAVASEPYRPPEYALSELDATRWDAGYLVISEG